jgi:hypothetical protein
MAAQSKKKRPAAPTPTPAKKLPVWWILGGLVGAALIAAIAVSLSGETKDASAAVKIGSPTVSGEALPTFISQDAGDPAIGMRIPSVAGTNFDGESVVIGPDTGAFGILFVAHWCSVCQDEVPLIQNWLDGGATPAAPIYTVATGIDELRQNYPPWTWLAREGWTGPVLVDDAANSVMNAFGGPAYPFFVFVNARGEVVGRVVGALNEVALDGALQFAVSN